MRRTPGTAALIAASVLAIAIATAAVGAATPPPRHGGSPTTTTLPTLPEPTGGATLLPGHRIVAYYGAANAPALGVLGEASPATLWPRLVAGSAPFATAGDPVVPAFELIAFAAQSTPSYRRSYTARIPDATIARYLAVVRAHHGLLILDIQPGRSNFLTDARTLVAWLSLPDVALGLDPEWELQPGELPDRSVGHTSATEVNAVSSWLEALVLSQHLPQKLLVIHQFTAKMVEDKGAVTAQPDIATVFNMDGFGGQANKLAIYHSLAVDGRFPLGLKLFFHADPGMFTPAEVLRVTPVPALVEYE